MGNLLAPQGLRDLTDKFLTEFFELAHALKVKEKAESKHPQLISDKRNDSYEFNYSLVECIVNSKFVQEKENDMNYVLMGHGFVSNTIKEFFNHSIKGINSKILFVIKNFKKQEEYLDYFAKNLKTETTDIIVDKVNPDYFKNRKKNPLFTKQPAKEIVHTFDVHNNKNEYVGTCKVRIEDGELDKIFVYGKSSTKDLQVTINSREEGEIHHFKHVADINSFFLMIDQITYGIEDTLKKEKKKTKKVKSK